MARPVFTLEVDWDTVPESAFIIGESLIGGADVIVGQFVSDYAGTYDDLTAEWRDFQIKRGRQDAGQELPAGEAVVALVDDDGKFNPRNSSSVLAGKLVPMRPLRITALHNAITYTIFMGYVQSIEHRPADRTTVIIARDLFVHLSRIKPIIDEQAPSTTGSAIGLILGYLSFPSSLWDLDVGDVIPAFSADGSKTGLTLISELLATERGLFFIASNGFATFHDRNTRAGAPTAFTLTSTMTSARPATSLDQIVNSARVTRTGGVEQTAQDGLSIATYGKGEEFVLESPYLNDDDQAGDLATFIVAAGADPNPPDWGVSLVPTTTALTDDLLGAELGEGVAATESVGNSSGDYLIEGIEHSSSIASILETRLSLAERSAVVFIIGVSEIGSSDILGY